MKKTVLITGCSAGGLGHALAREYQARGLHVFATTRKLESMKDLRELPNVTLLALDVTSLDSIKSAVSAVQEHLGPGVGLDLLVNNGAITANSPALDTAIEDSRRIFETNVFGVMRMIQYFTPLLRISQGTIVNIGSVAGKMPFVFGSTYNATKAALHAYSDTLRIELRPFNIKVITVILGGVNTNIYRPDSNPLPPNSYYASIEARIRKLREAPGKSSMSPTSCAREMVPATLRRYPPRHLHVGSGGIFLSLVAWIIPRFILEFILYRALGLHKLVAERPNGKPQSLEN